MQSLINRYAHGLVAVPVIRSCTTRGVFDLLEGGRSISLVDLADETAANPGHLRVALRLLETLKWVERDDRGGWSATGRARDRVEIPGGITELYRIRALPALIGRDPGWPLGHWIERSRDGWAVGSALLRDLLDGVLLIPLLLALRELREGMIGDSPAETGFDRMAREPRRDVSALFEARGWTTGGAGGLALTEAGRSLMDRIFTTAVVASYSPMLARVDQLLFGDCAKIFRRDPSGHERHVDRTLNVSGSGVQHRRYFADIEALIAPLFDRVPMADQPRYVLDTGCGDGTLLRRVYAAIRDRTARGRVLDDHPVTMIGVDLNERARLEAARTLEGIPSLVLPGDIGDPEAILDELRRRGISDLDRILHVHSFLDHDRPFLRPDAMPAERSPASVPDHIVSVGRDGRLIPPAVALSSLIEHLARWSRVIGRHGLVILEVHCVDPAIAHRFLDESQSLHFDAFHGFSGQHLVGADDFLLAAAGAGLFPRRDSARRYPRSFPFTRITLHHFERLPYIVRHPGPDDLPALLEIERKCWPDAPCCPEGELRRRVECFPQDQLVLERDGRPSAVAYTQPIADAGSLRGPRRADLAGLRSPRGRAIHLLGFKVPPAERGQGLNDRFLDFLLSWAACRDGVEHLIAVETCRDFARNAGRPSLNEYVPLRDDSGQLVDSVLRFHESRGAEVGEIVGSLGPEPADVFGHAVLIAYDLRANHGQVG
jgi:hypothetical protein